MKCPQCQCENKFPVPGLCPECYKQWKEDMRARYGPGPWPTVPSGEHPDKPEVWVNGSMGNPPIPDTSASLSDLVERSLTVLIKKLQEPSSDGAQLLTQVDALLREVTFLLAHSITEQEGCRSTAKNGTVCIQERFL